MSPTTGDKKDWRKAFIKTVHKARQACSWKDQDGGFPRIQSAPPLSYSQQRKFENFMPFYVTQVKERDRKSCLVKNTLRQKSFSALVLIQERAIKKQREPNRQWFTYSSTTRSSAKNEIVSLAALINYNCCLRRIHKRGLSTSHATSTYQQGSFCQMVRKENSSYVKGNLSLWAVSLL